MNIERTRIVLQSVNNNSASEMEKILTILTKEKPDLVLLTIPSDG
jgi:PleD family two-component response regulator